MKQIPRILILAEMSREFARGLLSGFARYSQIHRPLMFVTPPPFYLRGSIERRQFFSWIDRLTIDDVVSALCVSRRSLYAKFKARLGRSVHDEIVRVRLGRLLTLLSDTNLPISQIAEIMGFPGPDKLYCFFRRETGKTPSQYRKEVLPHDE